MFRLINKSLRRCLRVLSEPLQYLVKQCNRVSSLQSLLRMIDPRAISVSLRLPSRPSLLFIRTHGAQALKNAINASGSALRTASIIGIGSGISVMASGAPRVAAARGGNNAPYNNNNGGLFGGNVTVTQVLLGLNVALFGLQLASKEVLTLWGVKVNSLILAGQWWRLITPAFLHGNLIHLLVNSMSLNNLGPSVETLSGGKRLLAVYLVAAVAGNVASFFGSTAPSLGASGAVFGVGGALAMYFVQNKELYGKRADVVLQQLWQTLLINIAYGVTNPRIDNWGHLGGLVGGALAAYLLGPKYELGMIKGQKYLVDKPPIPVLASPPRRLLR